MTGHSPIGRWFFSCLKIRLSTLPHRPLKLAESQEQKFFTAQRRPESCPSVLVCIDMANILHTSPVLIVCRIILPG